MKAYVNLVKYSLKKGYAISVFDGEEWAVKRGKKYKQIINAIESVDESKLRIRDSDGNIMGWALIIMDAGFEPEESVADMTETPFMLEWAAQYK